MSSSLIYCGRRIRPRSPNPNPPHHDHDILGGDDDKPVRDRERCVVASPSQETNFGLCRVKNTFLGIENWPDDALLFLHEFSLRLNAPDRNPQSFLTPSLI